MDRIIFTVFLPVDQQIYSKLLHLYFPLEAQTKNGEKAVTDKSGKVKEDNNARTAEGDGKKKKEEQEEMEVEEAGIEKKEGTQIRESSYEEDRIADVPILRKSVTEPGRVIA